MLNCSSDPSKAKYWDHAYLFAKGKGLSIKNALRYLSLFTLGPRILSESSCTWREREKNLPEGKKIHRDVIYFL